MIYVIGVIFGGLCAGLWSPDTALVGASGGVYALVLAHISNIIMNCGEMDKKALIMRIVFLTPLVLLAIGDCYLAVQRYLVGTEDGGKVSYAAHVGGTIVGLFLGTNTLRNYNVESHEKYIKWVFLGIFGLFTVYAVVATIINWV